MIVIKVCEILHELIKSTAIAGLTLVGAFNQWELGYSMMFVSNILLLFVLNKRRMRTMDSDQYRSLADLLEDDDPDERTTGEAQWKNPNRYLKALLLKRGDRWGLSRRTYAVLLWIVLTILCISYWVWFVWVWITDHFLDDGQYGGEETRRFFGGVLLVGTLMFLFCVFFEIFTNYVNVA